MFNSLASSLVILGRIWHAALQDLDHLFTIAVSTLRVPWISPASVHRYPHLWIISISIASSGKFQDMYNCQTVQYPRSQFGSLIHVAGPFISAEMGHIFVSNKLALCNVNILFYCSESSCTYLGRLASVIGVCSASSSNPSSFHLSSRLLGIID